MAPRKRAPAGPRRNPIPRSTKTATASRGKQQTKPVELKIATAEPTRKSRRRQELPAENSEGIEHNSLAKIRVQQQQPAEEQDRTGATAAKPSRRNHKPPAPKPAPEQRPRPNTRSRKRKAFVDDQQPTATAPAAVEEPIAKRQRRTAGTGQGSPGNPGDRTSVYPYTSSSNLTLGWVMNNPDPEGMAQSKSTMGPPPKRRATQRQGAEKRKRAEPSPLRSQGSNAGNPPSESPSEQNGTANSKTSRMNEIYKKDTCRQKLRDGTESVHLFMSEVEMYRNISKWPKMTEESETWLRKLKENRREGYEDVRFQVEALGFKLERLQTKNERAVCHSLQDIICPIVEDLADHYINDPEGLWDRYRLYTDHWGSAWTKQSSLLPDFPRPKPDYCVGFSPSAFSDVQLRKIRKFGVEKRILTADDLMYFPFLTCEAKSHLQNLDLAENQNGYSMLVSIRAMLELFRAAMPEYNVSGEVLAFSVAYDHQQAYVHAYYPVVDAANIHICRHQMYRYSHSPELTSDPWWAWNVIRNVYELWAPDLHRRLCQAIDAIPEAPVASSQAPSISDVPMEREGSVSTVRQRDPMSVDGGSAHGAD